VVGAEAPGTWRGRSGGSGGRGGGGFLWGGWRCWWRWLVYIGALVLHVARAVAPGAHVRWW